MAGLAAWPVNTHPKTCKIPAGQIQKFLAVQSVSSRKANGKVDVRFTTGWLDRRWFYSSSKARAKRGFSRSSAMLPAVCRPAVVAQGCLRFRRMAAKTAQALGRRSRFHSHPLQ